MITGLTNIMIYCISMYTKICFILNKAWRPLCQKTRQKRKQSQKIYALPIFPVLISKTATEYR